MPTKVTAPKGKTASAVKGKKVAAKSKPAPKVAASSAKTKTTAKTSAKATTKATAKTAVKVVKLAAPVKAPASKKPKAAKSAIAGLDAITRLKTMIEHSLDADKAEALVSYDLVGRSSLADYMIIASGSSARHVSAMAEHLREKLEDAGKNPHIEGVESGDWVLIDVGDIIVHLFRPEVREFYQLEHLWAPESSVAATR